MQRENYAKDVWDIETFIETDEAGERFAVAQVGIKGPTGEAGTFIHVMSGIEHLVVPRFYGQPAPSPDQYAVRKCWEHVFLTLRLYHRFGDLALEENFSQQKLDDLPAWL